MTDLRKPIQRRTVEACPAVRRRLVVALLPGDVIEFREAGRRRRYSAPLARVFAAVARWNVDAERAEARKTRCPYPRNTRNQGLAPQGENHE